MTVIAPYYIFINLQENIMFLIMHDSAVNAFASNNCLLLYLQHTCIYMHA